MWLFCINFPNFWHNLAFPPQHIHMCSWQWLSATNKSNLCHRDWVQKTMLKQISNFFVVCHKGNEKNPKTYILSNLNFTTAIKLLWGIFSPFFHNILQTNNHHHPLICMKWLEWTDLSDIIDFIYYGEISVAKDNIIQFLESRRIKVKRSKSSNVEMLENEQ